MNRHSMDILEFHQVIDELRHFSLIEAENSGITELGYYYDASELRRELKLVGIFKKLAAGNLPRFATVQLTGSALKMVAKEGIVLDLEDLSRIVKLVNAYNDCISWLHIADGHESITDIERQLIGQFAENWPTPAQLLGELSPYFHSDGNFKEDEIPPLRSILLSIQRLHGQIRETARQYLGDNKEMWSSDEAAQRNGRVVLALKSDYRGKVQGLVHGTSGSGQTIYIEPQELLEKNNSLNEARSNYQRELHRILLKCSSIVREKKDDIAQYESQLLRFNSLYARARYSKSIGAVSAGVRDDTIHLIEAKHPALGKQAVPINIRMENGSRILVLSGPNTGGKTVAMKTLGVLSLMHQSGMEIPASEETLLPVFSNILADIGDEQSIGAGLSTFSAHLQNVSNVLKYAKNNALVLLDELGSGTNPMEGSALSMAVMESLSQREVFAMVTTHHDSLKAYAYNNEKMENASVEFDSISLRPTYTIVSGIPGESHALDIAERVGMDPRIVQRAREYIKGESLSMQQLIENLRSQERELRSKLAEQKETKLHFNSLKEDLAKRESILRTRELAVEEQRLLEHSQYISQSRKKIEAMIQNLSIRSQENADAAVDTKHIRRELDRLSKTQDSELDRIRNAQEHHYEQHKFKTAPSYEIGAQVRYKGAVKIAEIVAKGKQKNSWVILAGSIRISVPEKDLELIREASEPDRISAVHVDIQSNDKNAPSCKSGITLDIRGLRFEEANTAVLRYLDNSAMQGLEFFSVIHGKGTGVLQQVVHGALGDDDRVVSLQFAPPEDGGYGKTYVYLK